MFVCVCVCEEKQTQAKIMVATEGTLFTYELN